MFCAAASVSPVQISARKPAADATTTLINFLKQEQAFAGGSVHPKPTSSEETAHMCVTGPSTTAMYV